MKSLLFIAVWLSASACTGSLLQTKIPAATVYVLTAAPSADAATSGSMVDLAVSVPTTAPGLDTDRIAVLKETRHLDYYREAVWGATLPRVAQALVVGSLQNQKMFRSVTTEQARVTTNYFLDLEVRDFQAEYASEASAPTAHVTLVGSLIRIKDRKLIGVFPATVTAAVPENRLNSVVEALESAARQASLSLGKQVAGAIAANPAD